MGNILDILPIIELKPNFLWTDYKAAFILYRMNRLARKVNRYRIFEEYLLRVIDLMPEDYLAASDDKMKGLMSRHRTLSDSNEHLVNKLISMGDEVL